MGKLKLCSSPTLVPWQHHGLAKGQRLHRSHISAASPKAPQVGPTWACPDCSAAWGNRCFQEKGVQGQVREGNVRWTMENPCSCRALSRQGTGGAFLSLLRQDLLMKNEPHAPVLATNAFPCGFLCAAVAFCRHLDSITLLIQPIKLETEHCGRQRSVSDSSCYNVLGLECPVTQDGALQGPGVQGAAPCPRLPVLCQERWESRGRHWLPPAFP